MNVTISFGNLAGATGPGLAPKQESPYRIGVLGDFTGRHNRGLTGSSEDIAARKLIRVNRENLDEVMAKLAVQLNLQFGDNTPTVDLTFASLDDFHPDKLHDSVGQIIDAFDAEEKSERMHSVLHHPDFQALEAAWRGLDWLLRRAIKGSQVEVMLLDLSMAELTQDLKASDNLSETGLHQLLIEKAVHGPKGDPWAVLVGLYHFDMSAAHAELLGRLAKIGSQSKAPFLASLSSRVLDKSFTPSPDAAEAWLALRQLPEAALLGLALPRFLLRLPYGENTQSIDRFSYEEMTLPPDRGNYLWGNPALGCGALLAQAFLKQGWSGQPGTVLALENLPIHVYTVDDEEEVTLAEAWLVKPQTEQLVKQGIMPLLCVRGKGEVQLGRFLSLAQPGKDGSPRALHGRWSKEELVVGPPQQPSAPPAEVAPAPPPQAPVSPAPAAAAPAPAAPAASKPEPEPPPPEPEESPVAPAEAEAPAVPPEEEMDPDLAALLKQLE
jgi:type VI secretion system protein ImpC